MDSLQDIFGTSRPVAVVTGGARRVGRYLCEALAASGYRVAIHAHDSIEAAQELAARFREQEIEALVVQADLTQEGQVKAMFDQIQWYFGRINLMINCAAIWNPTPLTQVTAEDVEAHFRANVLGTFLCCQWAGRRMVDQPHGGAIINIGDWGVARPYPGFSAYFAAKGTIITLTQDFAVELAAANPAIRVNAIHPGQVLLPEDASEQRKQAIIDSTLVKRLGRPEDVFRAVRFLAESRFVTGVAVPVDGGRTIYSVGEVNETVTG
ncbi:MAG: SDR family oxidoreductase [Pirellulaceae bacterium]